MKSSPETPALLSLKLPSDFKLESLPLINAINRSATFPIRQLYGSIPYFLPSSRASHCLPTISLSQLAEYLAACRSYGITFNYTLNAITGLDPSDLHHLDKLLNAGVNHFTVATAQLANHLLKLGICPDISVVANLNTPDILRKFLETLDAPVKRICLPEQLNHRHDLLSLMISSFPAISFELIINSFCYQNCPNLLDHYRFICTPEAEQHDPLEFWCTNRKMSRAFAEQLSYIPPDQLCRLQELGIHQAKLAGRELIANACYDIINSWAAGHYQGNGNKLLLLGADNWYQRFPPWNI